MSLSQPISCQCVFIACVLSGVLASNGESWKEMRRFATTNLRDFGTGKKAGEDKVPPGM